MAAALLIPSEELSEYGILVPQTSGHGYSVVKSSLKGLSMVVLSKSTTGWVRGRKIPESVDI